MATHTRGPARVARDCAHGEVPESRAVPGGVGSACQALPLEQSVWPPGPASQKAPASFKGARPPPALISGGLSESEQRRARGSRRERAPTRAAAPRLHLGLEALEECCCPEKHRSCVRNAAVNAYLAVTG